MLDKFKKERESGKLREWLSGIISGAPVWNVFASRSQWLCPFCGQVGAAILARTELVDKALAHLCDKCPVFHTGVREPRFSKDQLDQKALFLEVKNQIVANPAWQQRNVQGHWYCPYCVRDSEVQIPLDGKINLEVVDKMYKHVESCFAFDHGRGGQKTLAELQRAIGAADAVTKMVILVKQRIAQSPVWRVKDPKGFWICPYCRQVMLSISASSQMVLTQTAPAQIAAHLVNHCLAYRAKKEPAANELELEAIFRPAAPTPPPGVLPPVDTNAQTRIITDQMIKSMQKELAAVKANQQVDVDTRRGLAEAAKRQMQMLPDLPKLPGFDFHVTYKPMSHVAGDFYDFPRVTEDSIGILIGDVAGHGIEAGMVMALVKKVISIHSKGKVSPKAALVAANLDIYPDLDRQTFATVCYCVLNQTTKELAITRAGHNPIYIFNPARSPNLLSLEPKGMPVGVDKGMRFEAMLEEIVVQLQAGDMVLIYTDGIPETTNPKGEEFGFERVQQQLAQYGAVDPKVLLTMLDLAVNEFRGAQRAVEDDITVIGIKVK